MPSRSPIVVGPRARRQRRNETLQNQVADSHVDLSMAGQTARRRGHVARRPREDPGVSLLVGRARTAQHGVSTMCLLSIHNCDPHRLFPNTCLRNRSLLRVAEGGWQEGRPGVARWNELRLEGGLRKYETSPGPSGTEAARSASRFLPARSEFAYGTPGPTRAGHPLARKRRAVARSRSSCDHS